MTFDQILQSISQKKFAPIYYLYGEESWFIDQIAQALDSEGVVLTESEAAFNRTVCYGPETSAKQIVNACRSFPVMANHRLVIVKEGQRLNKQEAEKLVPYLEKPVPSTILVLIYKGRRMALPKKAEKALHAKSLIYHAKKLYDRDVQGWVQRQIQARGFEADPSIPAILTANLGIDIGLIENELEKMFIYLQATKQSKLTQQFVYDTINVDKEFNSFELVHALSERNVYRSHLIVERLSRNPKINPPILTINSLFQFFHNLALVHRHKLRDPNSVKNQLRVNYFQAKDYIAARQRYNLGQVYRNLGLIEQADLSLKGQNPTNMDARHLLKTLVWEILR
ncbi:MAG: DNA polymerase III subunit delta [Bacteroidota bacterium]